MKWTANYRWAEEALEKHHGTGNGADQAYVLEAVLVGPQGIAIPILAEFCENTADAPEESKQDSELKAFYRLARKLKTAFPRLPLTILLDGLYPNGPLFRFLRTLRWDFLIGLKEGNLRAFQAMAHKLSVLAPHQRLTYQWGDRTQNFWWVNNLEYTWRDPETGRTRRTVVHYVHCTETWTDANGDRKVSKWAWVSARPFSKKTVVTRCNRMARHRWDIEEHILQEKHYGYHYTHLYSRQWNAMKGFHTLMRLAHLLNTLALHQVALWPTVQAQGIGPTIRWVYQTFAGNWLDTERIVVRRARPHSLRLVW